MTSPLIDKLIEEDEIIVVKNEEETKIAIEELMTPLTVENEFSFSENDYVRTTLNARHLKGLTPIRLDMEATNLGQIEKPVFLSPASGSVISKHAFELLLGPFNDTRLYKDTHKSTTWIIAEDIDFQTISDTIASIIFKTNYHVSPTHLGLDKTYYIKAKFNGTRSESEWSDVIILSTKKAQINTPRIIIPEPNIVLNKELFFLRAAAFSTTPINDTAHISSTWQLSKTAVFDLLDIVWNFTSALAKDSVLVPSNVLENGIKYYARMKHNGQVGESDWSPIVPINSNYAINKPSIVSPSNNTSVSKYGFKLTSSPYVTDPVGISPLLFTEAVMSKMADFSIIEQTFKQAGDLGIIDIASSYFDFTTDYWFKLKHIGNTAESVFSDPIKITTNKIVINKPVIIDPINNENASKVSFWIKTEPFATTPANDTTHNSTIFQVSKTLAFNDADLILNQTVFSDLLSLMVPMEKLLNGTTYYIRVKFNGIFSTSEWSDITTCTIPELATINDPIFTPIKIDDPGFGTDATKLIGKVKSTRNITDPNDAIIFGKWSIAKSVDFLTEPVEVLVSTYPDTFPVKLTDPYFEIGGEYWIKVAFKTIASGDFGDFTNPLHFTIGTPSQPTISKLDIINPDITTHKLLLECTAIEISDGFFDQATKMTIQISDLEEVETIEELEVAYPNFNTVIAALSLKGEIGVKIKYTGFYFGDTPWSDAWKTLVTGMEEQPEILSCAITYDESSGSLKTFVDITGSAMSLTGYRKDTHIKSKWLIRASEGATQTIIDSGWVDDLTSYRKEMNLEGLSTVTVSVQHKMAYLGEGIISSTFSIQKEGYVRKPVITFPANEGFVTKGIITVISSVMEASPNTLVHTRTVWKLVDFEGTEVWAKDTIVPAELTTIDIPDTLTYGSQYTLTAKYQTDNELWTSLSSPIKFTIKPNLTLPIITSPLSDAVVDDGGFDIVFSEFSIDPAGWDGVARVDYQVSTDVDFNSLPINSSVNGNATSIRIGAGVLVSDKDHWVRIKQVGYKCETLWSAPIKFKTPVSSIATPSILTPTSSQVIGETLNNLFSTSNFTSSAIGTVPHLQTEWLICKFNTFDNDVKVITVGNNGSINMLQATINPWTLDAGTDYYAKVRHRCNNSISGWSAVRNFVTE